MLLVVYLYKIVTQHLSTEDELKVVTKKAPTAEQMQDLLFAWRVAKFVKSNAIVYAHNLQTVGIGAGQMESCCQ